MQCEWCGANRYIQLNQFRYEAARFCSQACHYESTRGVEKVTKHRYVTKAGYVMLKTGIRSHRAEHRLVIEKKIGRTLQTDEQVHHKNGDKADNRLRNLLVLTNTEHQRLHDHVQTRSQRLKFKCQECGADYEKKASRKDETHYCSLSCRSKATAKKRWHKQKEK